MVHRAGEDILARTQAAIYDEWGLMFSEPGFRYKIAAKNALCLVDGDGGLRCFSHEWIGIT
jgi:hypothetical protein